MNKVLVNCLIVAIVMSLGLSGCAEPKIDDGQIKKYKSTKKDVRRVLGAPNMTSTRNEKETWTYTKSSAGINKKGAAVRGVGYLANAIIPGASWITTGVQTAVVASDLDNASPISGQGESASYTFNKRGVLISISKSSFRN